MHTSTGGAGVEASHSWVHIMNDAYAAERTVDAGAFAPTRYRWLASPGGWEELCAHDAQGRPTRGSWEALRAAASAGCSFKVGLHVRITQNSAAGRATRSAESDRRSIPHPHARPPSPLARAPTRLAGAGRRWACGTCGQGWLRRARRRRSTRSFWRPRRTSRTPSRGPSPRPPRHTSTNAFINVIYK